MLARVIMSVVVIINTTNYYHDDHNKVVGFSGDASRFGWNVYIL